MSVLEVDSLCLKKKCQVADVLFVQVLISPSIMGIKIFAVIYCFL